MWGAETIYLGVIGKQMRVQTVLLDELEQIGSIE